MGSSLWPSRKVTRPGVPGLVSVTDLSVVIVASGVLYQWPGRKARKFCRIFRFDFRRPAILVLDAYGKTTIPILFRSLEYQRRSGSLRPATRPAQTFDWKLEQLKKLGFDAMMFHDDDAVPDIDGKSDAQLRKEAKELKKKLDDAGVAAEMVAPRLWFSPMTIDGAYTSNDPKAGSTPSTARCAASTSPTTSAPT